MTSANKYANMQIFLLAHDKRACSNRKHGTKNGRFSRRIWGPATPNPQSAPLKLVACYVNRYQFYHIQHKKNFRPLARNRPINLPRDNAALLVRADVFCAPQHTILSRKRSQSLNFNGRCRRFIEKLVSNKTAKNFNT